MTDLLNVTVNCANIVKPTKRKAFAIYEIEVSSTTAALPWLLYKRYTDFEELHQKLTKMINSPEYRNIQNVKLLQLPGKKVFGSRRRDVIEKRRQEFQTYLQNLLQQNIFLQTSVLMNFLNVPETLRQIILNKTSVKKIVDRRSTEDNGSDTNTALPEEIRHVYDLLRKLNMKNRNSYCVKALHEFEKWYFSGLHRIHTDYIQKLLIGDPMLASSNPDSTANGVNDSVGLIQSCRVSDNIRVVSRNTMALMAKFLDIERNADARNCINIFLTLDPKYYAMMELHKHMQENSHDHSFRIGKMLYEHLPHLNITEYICDHSSVLHFMKWYQLKQQGCLGRKDYYPSTMPKYTVSNSSDEKESFLQLNSQNLPTPRRGSAGGLAPSINEETNQWSYNCQDYSSYFKISESIEEQFDYLHKEPTHTYQSLSDGVLGNGISSQLGLSVWYKKEYSKNDPDNQENKNNDHHVTSLNNRKINNNNDLKNTNTQISTKTAKKLPNPSLSRKNSNSEASSETHASSLGKNINIGTNVNNENNNDNEINNDNNNINIIDTFTPMQPHKSWKVRISATLNHSAKDVYNFLVLGYVKNKDGIVQGWNRKVIDWMPLAKLDDRHIIYQETYKSFNSPYKFRHFIVLRYLKPNEEKGIYKVIFASVSNYESLISEGDEEKKMERQESVETNADTKDLQKAYILPSGFHIQQNEKNPNQCHLEFIAHLTPESVLIVAPDLLGETNELFESVASIEHLVGVMKDNLRGNTNTI